MGFQDSGFRVEVYACGCRVEGSGWRVKGGGMRVEGQGFRLPDLCFFFFEFVVWILGSGGRG